MRASAATRWRSWDDLTVLGLVCLMAWLASGVEALRRGAYSELLWLCQVSMAVAGIGFLVRSRVLLTAQFAGLLVIHLSWHVDFAAYLLTGRMPLWATAYMFDGAVTASHKGLSFFQHTFPIPALVWGLARLGPSAYGWAVQTIEAAVVVGLTGALTAPASNVNWIFGAGFAELSPAATSPGLYYTLMVAVPPLFVYLPTNALALRFDTLVPSDRLARLARGDAALLAVAFAATLAGISVLVGAACHVRLEPSESLLQLPPVGPSPLESLASGPDAPDITAITFGCPGRETPISLRPLKPPRPRGEAETIAGQRLRFDNLLRVLRIEDAPAAPQEIVVRGRRGHTGRGVCAIVGSDRLYLQSPCDLSTASDRFELRAHLGRRGLPEFLPPSRSGAPAAADDSGGRLYALTVVSLGRDGPHGRSATYVLRRTGIDALDDVAWEPSGGGRVPLVRPSTTACDGP